MAQNSKTSHTVTLTDNATGKSIELPVIEGSVGPSVIDIRKLYSETGYFTYDPGFTSTGSCQSELTYIDGDVGILRHRGYAIDELAEQSDFLEVCYLLIYGDLLVTNLKHLQRRHKQAQSINQRQRSLQWYIPTTLLHAQK